MEIEIRLNLDDAYKVQFALEDALGRITKQQKESTQFVAERESDVRDGKLPDDQETREEIEIGNGNIRSATLEIRALERALDEIKTQAGNAYRK